MKFQRSIAVFTAILCCLFAFQYIAGFANATGDPIRVSSQDDLQRLKDVDISGKMIVLTKDITLKGSYTSFNVSDAILDGGGYSIYGANKPIFDSVKNSTVKNLGVSGASTSTGMLANTIQNTNINSCYFEGRVSGGKSGFIAGTNSGGTVTNVAASGSINAGSTAIFFGSNSGTVSSSWFAGTINGDIASLAGYNNCYYDKEVAGVEIALSDLKNHKLGGSWVSGNYPRLKSIKAKKYAVPFFRGDDGVHRGLAITARTADGQPVKSGQQASGPITVTAQGVGKITYSINGGAAMEYTGPVTINGKDKIVFSAGGYTSRFNANTTSGGSNGGGSNGGNGGSSGSNGGNKGNVGSGGYISNGDAIGDNFGSEVGDAIAGQLIPPPIQENEEEPEEPELEVRDPMNGNIIESEPEAPRKSSGTGHAKGFGGEVSLLVVVGGILIKRWFIK